MKRDDLLQTLKLAAPALLSDNDAVLPILKSLRFTGTHVVASNDVIAISLKVPVTEMGIVPGRKLISFLGACSSKTAKVSLSKKGRMIVKCASARLQLESKPEDEWPFEFPAIEDAETLVVNESFFEAIERCSAQSTDTGLSGWQGGIIFSFGTVFGIYGVGQSRATISYSRVEGIKLKNSKITQRIVVPSSFCKAAINMAGGLGTDAILYKTDETAMLWWDEGTNIISTKLMTTDMPDVTGRFNSVAGEVKKFFPITPAFTDALRRAAMLGEKGICSLTTDDKEVLMVAKGGGVVLRETIKFEKGKVPDVDQKVSASLIVRQLDKCRKIAFGPRATVLQSETGEFTHVVANWEE